MNSVNLKKRLSNLNLPFENLRSLDQVFSVIQCSGQAEFHMSAASGREHPV
jgi:hypothetical protein